MSPTLEHKIDLDLARKLKTGAIAHGFLVALVLGSTPLLNDAPRSTMSIAALIVVLNACRFALCVTQKRFYPNHAETWRALFTLFFVLVALSWAGLAHLTFHTYPMPSYPATVIVLILAGISAGANSGLAAKAGFSRAFNGILIGFPILSLSQATGTEAVAVWIMLGIFLVYQWVLAGHTAREFNLLVQREADLELSQQAIQTQERERELAERSLKESDERFRELADASLDGVLVHDGEHVIDANEGFAKIMGYARAEVLHSPILRYFPLETRESMRERSRQAKEAPYDMRAMRKDGTLIVLEVQARNCLYRGEPARVGSVRDVTARRRAEFELRESMASLRRIIDSSPTPILLMTKNGNVSLWNPASEKVFGWSADEVLGRPLPFVPNDRLEESQGLIHRLRMGESVVGYETERQRKDGSPIMISISSVPVRNEKGEIESIMAILHDITASKESEKAIVAAREVAESAARAKSEFLANMSHEIRTPINGILGMTGFLLDSKLTPEQHEQAKTIENSADTLLSIINDILDVSKIEAGRLEFESIDFNFREMLDDTTKILRYMAEKKGLRLKVEIDTAIPVSLCGDPGRLRQIVTNLVSNALKFTSEGSISVRAKREHAGESGETLIRFEIEDTGIGISTEAMRKLFQPFSQADAATNRRFGGSGLGLSISKYLAENMGGRIGAESKIGRGSIFWFTACLKAAKPQTQTATTAKKTYDFSAERPYRVLVAEDNPVNQKITLKQLEAMGIRADAVANGFEVLAALDSLPYDLILMDCQMPEMDGYEATRAIRARDDQRTNDLPIVALTANALQGDREKCFAAGMNDYLAKPIRAPELGKTLERWLMPEKKSQAS